MKIPFLIVLLLINIYPLRAQNAIIKSINDPLTHERGFDLIRYEQDSILFLSDIWNLNSQTIGFHLHKTDLSLNLIESKQFTSTNVQAFALNDLNDNTFLITGGRGFSVGPSFGTSLLRINRSGDTLWTRSYIPIDSIFGIRLQYAGHFNDTLVLFGDIGFEDGFFSLQGFLMYVHRQTGQIIMTKTYSDSLNTCSFIRGLVDTTLNKIYLSGTSYDKANIGLGQAFFTALDAGGNPIYGYMLSDSSNVGNGCIVKNETDHSLSVGYRTQKYFTGSAIEFVKIDSLGNIINCMYNSTPSFGNLPIDGGDWISNTNSIRLWTNNYFIELDTAFNYLSGERMFYQFPAFSYFGESWSLFSDCMLGTGDKKSNQFSTFDLLVIKTDPNGDNCYSNTLTPPLNFIPGRLNEMPFAYQVSDYFNITEVPLPMTITTYTPSDSLYCITTLAEQTTSSTPTIYPNPASDVLYLRGISPGKINTIISDLSGRLCQSNLFYVEDDQQEYSLDIRNLSSGTFYLLTIQSENKPSITLKIVK